MAKTIEQHDEELDEKELLKGVPVLLPPEQFRQRQRSAVLSLLNRLRGVVDEDGAVRVDDIEGTSRLLDILADADEFFESIAADREQYVQWSTGLKDSEQILGALVSKYARAVGE